MLWLWLLLPLPPSRELGLLVGWVVAAGGGGGAADETVTEGVLVGAGETDGVFVGDGVELVAAAAPGAPGDASEPAAPCGHQTTRQADRASIAATTMRARFVRALLTTSS